MRKEDIPKTSFRTKYGHFEFLDTTFGLTRASGCFQTLMNKINHPYLDEFIILYNDDILVYSKNKNDHLKHLRKVFDLLKAETNLYEVIKM